MPYGLRELLALYMTNASELHGQSDKKSYRTAVAVDLA